MKNVNALQKYQKSIPMTMRSRGMRVLQFCEVKILSDTELSCEAMVESESDNGYYTVELNDNKNIYAECDCPFFEDHGPCKHISAVISKLLYENEIKLPNRSPATKKFNSADVVVPYHSITREYVESISNDHNRSAAKILLERNSSFIKIKELWKGHVRAEMKEQLWGNPWYISMDIVDDKIHMKCTCKQTVAALCSHKHTLLQSITKNFQDPDVLVNQPPKESLLDAALAEYGFSSNDKNIEKIFRFETTSTGQYIAIPLQAGIVKTSAYDKINNNLWSSLQAFHLPVENPEKKEDLIAKAYGYVLDGPFELRNLCMVPEIRIITGTLNKEKNDLVKNIYSKQETIFQRISLPVPTEKSEHLMDLVDSLQESHLRKLAKSYQKTEQDPELYLISYITEKLHEAKLLLKDELFYKSTTRQYSKNSLHRISFSERNPEIRLTIKYELPFITLSCKVFIDNKEIKDLQSGYRYYYYYFGDKVHLLANSRDVEVLHNFIVNPVIKVHHSDEENFINGHMKSLGKYYNIEMAMAKKIKKKSATFESIALYLSEVGNFLMLRPVVHYSQGDVDLFSKEEILKKEGGSFISYARNEEQETAVKNNLLSTHPDFSKQIDRGFFYVHFDKILVNGWYFTFFTQLKEWNIAAFGLEKIKRANYHPYKPTIKTKIASGIDWFDIKIDISFGDNIVSLREVQKALLKKENYVRLGDGTIGLLPQEWIEKHAALLRTSEIDKSGNAKLTKMHFNILDELLQGESNEAIHEEIRIKKQKLIHFEGIKPHGLPQGLDVTLRPYQQEGYNWLMFLDEFGWGGCLADDMGLGKTIQMIAFLKRQHELHPKKTNLVVLPTSLIFNWKRELKKFAPDLKYLDFSGTFRDKEEKFSNFPVVLTTYGLIINDIEKLRKTTFNYIVLDESQAIKNPGSQRFKAVSLLKARNRIVMTGTPIENNTFDLYAQMSFANPGLLGNLTHFQNQYSIPIDKHGDNDAATSLRKLISPFMLRRTKEQVAKDLPDKTEDIIVCNMESEQRRIYDAFKDNYRMMISNKIDSDGLGKSSMMVLDALLKLRQICNSPALLNVEENYGDESIKIKELLRHLVEKTGNHKVLVFSQFTQMLKLVENKLQKLNITYEYLDGQTPGKDRELKVKNFQEDPSIRVFLISLKAGGVGLNLTEADYVYLIDPWWNPAVEAQAIDRTHRIGQKNKVFAYRMICKDTIEEKVLQLQDKKRKVAQDLISTEASFYKQLDKSDIMDLFS